MVVRMSVVQTALLFCFSVEGFNGPGTPQPPLSIVTEAPQGPSAVEVDDEWNKAVVHDFLAKQDCWDGLASSSSDCWTGANGENYRYGCKVGDHGKIYTDICQSSTCEPDSCLGEWTWHEEYHQTCYNDGSAYYQFDCTELGLGDTYEVASEPGHIEGASQKTCQQLGWENTLNLGKSPYVCAQSKLGTECLDEKTFKEAEDACHGEGGRLCTSDELAEDEAKGSGCKGDCKPVWSSTECKGGNIFQAGAAKCLKDVPMTCSVAGDKASVRCCADSVNNKVGPSSGLPAGYSLATTSDFSAEDGICGGDAAAEYSCWTNPTTGASQRFACTKDSDYIWAQSCGTDPTCGGSNCEGEWRNQQERLGQCYRDPSGDLYSYDC